MLRCVCAMHNPLGSHLKPRSRILVLHINSNTCIQNNAIGEAAIRRHPGTEYFCVIRPVLPCNIGISHWKTEIQMQMRACFDMIRRMFQYRAHLQSQKLQILAAALIALCVFTAMTFAARASTGVQLVMMEEAGCSWCEKWQAEIGVFYHRTREGRIAPLRRIDVHDPVPADLKFLKPAYFTPTFVLVAQGREIGRIQGYPGEDFFWSLLGDLIEKLPPAGNFEAEAKL